MLRAGHGDMWIPENTATDAYQVLSRLDWIPKHK